MQRPRAESSKSDAHSHRAPRLVVSFLSTQAVLRPPDAESMNGGVPGGELDALVLDDALPRLRSTRKTRGHVRSGDAMAATRSMHLLFTST